MHAVVVIIRPHCMQSTKMWPIVTDDPLFMCLLDTIVSRSAETILVPFGLWTRVSPRKHVFGG